MIKIGKYYYRSLWAWVEVVILRRSVVVSCSGIKIEPLDWNSRIGEEEYKKMKQMVDEYIKLCAGAVAEFLVGELVKKNTMTGAEFLLNDEDFKKRFLGVPLPPLPMCPKCFGNPRKTCDICHGESMDKTHG